MSILSVIIDQREPTNIQHLKFGEAAVSCSLLDAGDLLAVCDDGTLIAVERKAAEDLLGSIRDNRIWTQLTGLKDLTRWAYLVIVGELRCGTNGNVQTDSRVTGWTWVSLQGALLQAQEMGIFVVQVANESDYEAAILRLAARSHREEMLVPPVRLPKVLSDVEQVICSLPGIGPEKVLPILKYTNTVGWALSWLSELDSKERVPGIGNGIKRNIRTVLGLAENEILSVIYKETGLPVKEMK